MSALFNETEVDLSYHCISKLTNRTSVRELKLNNRNKIWLKCENEQVTGSFKVRGALNAVSRIDQQHIVTASAGNHGLGIAYACNKFNKQSTIFLPENTSKNRISELEELGAIVFVNGQSWDEANCVAYKYSRENRYFYIHPFADEYVILGQSTLFTEFYQQVPDLDCVLMTSGGGGLVSGAVLANRLSTRKIDIISVEPIGAPTIYESVKKGYVVKLDTVDTQASSVAVKQSSHLNFNLYSEHVHDFILVDDDDAHQAKEFLIKTTNQDVELCSAIAVAAVIKNLNKVKDKYLNIGIVICAKERAVKMKKVLQKEEVFI